MGIRIPIAPQIRKIIRTTCATGQPLRSWCGRAAESAAALTSPAGQGGQPRHRRWVPGARIGERKRARSGAPGAVRHMREREAIARGARCPPRLDDASGSPAASEGPETRGPELTRNGGPPSASTPSRAPSRAAIRTAGRAAADGGADRRVFAHLSSACVPGVGPRKEAFVMITASSGPPGPDGDVALAALGLLPPSYPVLAAETVSVARTGCGSISAALGLGRGRRPAAPCPALRGSGTLPARVRRRN
jgi:hypothetical protein